MSSTTIIIICISVLFFVIFLGLINSKKENNYSHDIKIIKDDIREIKYKLSNIKEDTEDIYDIKQQLTKLTEHFKKVKK